MGEDDSWEAALAVDASGISAILGFQGSGVKLRRGFAPPDSANPTQVPRDLNPFMYLKAQCRCKLRNCRKASLIGVFLFRQMFSKTKLSYLDDF